MKKIILIMILIFSIFLISASPYNEIQKEFQRYNESDTPGILRNLLENSQVTIEINSQNQINYFSFIIHKYEIGNYSFEKFSEPDYLIFGTQKTLVEITEAPHMATKAKELYENNKIEIQPQNFKGKVLLRLAKWFYF